MTFRTLDDAPSLAGKTALVRVDFNVPMEGGKVTEDTRLRVALPTINRLRDAGARVALLAHFDRPKGQRVPEMSLQPVVDDLERVLGQLAGGNLDRALLLEVADAGLAEVELHAKARFEVGLLFGEVLPDALADGAEAEDADADGARGGHCEKVRLA